MKKIIIFVCFLIISSLSYCFTSINPTIFDKRIDNGGAGNEYYISNPTNSEIGYRIYVEPSESEKDMSKWIEFYPSSLKLKAGETKKIKVFVESPLNTEKGEYTAILGIKEVAVPNSVKEESAGVTIYTDLKLEIAGFVGDLKPELQITNFKASKDSIQFKIKNTGEIRTKVEAYIESKGHDPIFLDSFRLLQGKEKSFSTQIDLTKYSKNAKLVIYDLNDNKLYEKLIND